MSRLAVDRGNSSFSANWLLANLGQPAGYWMDTSLVQQLGLFDFRAGEYWTDWLEVLKIPPETLPAPVPTVHPYGNLTITGPDGTSANAPVWAMLGDQQAALFGHDCRQPGDTECTHGTASFVNVYTGMNAPYFSDVVNTYFAWTLEHQPTYCLEARTAATGSAIRWMRMQARLFDRDEEAGPLAASVPDAGGVTFVPAFTGLFAPTEDPAARGTILGLTLGSNRAHIVRAFLDGVAYEIRSILETVKAETKIQIEQLALGGGVSNSNEICQIQADLLGIPVVRPAFTETTARAAALLAGLGAGFWISPADLPSLPVEHTVFEPSISADQRDSGYANWLRAVELARGWPLQSTPLAPHSLHPDTNQALMLPIEPHPEFDGCSAVPIIRIILRQFKAVLPALTFDDIMTLV